MALNAQQILFGTAAPTGAAQSYQQGDVVINSTPGPGLPFAFQQTTAGIANSPGNWVPIGATQPQLAVTLTAANITSMFTTPVSIIPAPGAGLAIVVQYILFEMTTTATAYTGGGAVSFVYAGGAVNPVTGTITAATITAGAGTTNTLLGGPSAATGTVVPANTGVNITNATALFATGTGTAVIRVAYSIVTL